MDHWEQNVDQGDARKQSMDEPEQGPERPSALTYCPENEEVDQSKEQSGRKVHRIAKAFARLRSEVRIVPSRKGRSIRVRPNSLAVLNIVVKTRVPTNPPARAAQTLIPALPWSVKRRH